MPIIGSLAGASSRGLGGLRTFIPPIPPSSPVFDSISTSFLTSSTPDIYFNSIPSTYQHLQFRINGFSDNFGSIFMRINGDTDVNMYSSTGYWGQWNQANAQVSGILTGRSAILPGVGSFQFGTTYPYVMIIDVLDYKNTNKKKNIRSFHGASTNGTHYNDGVGVSAGNYNSTTAINSVHFFLDGGNVFRANTRIALYGIKES